MTNFGKYLKDHPNGPKPRTHRSTVPRRIVDVDTIPCGVGDGNHRLASNHAATVTACVWCHRTWADLDAELRIA